MEKLFTSMMRLYKSSKDTVEGNNKNNEWSGFNAKRK